MNDALRRAIVAAGYNPDAVAEEARNLNLALPESPPRESLPAKTLGEQLGLEGVEESQGILTIRPGTKRHLALERCRGDVLETNAVEFLQEFRAAGLVHGTFQNGWTISAVGEAALGMLDYGSLAKCEKGKVVPQTVRLDREAGNAARDRSMAQVDQAADPDWKARAWAALATVCGRGQEFTTDEVWVEIGDYPMERRALGPIMRAAADQGWIVNTGRRRNSARPEHHSYPCTIWQPVSR